MLILRVRGYSMSCRRVLLFTLAHHHLNLMIAMISRIIAMAGVHTRLRALQLGITILPLLPRLAISPHEPGNPLRIHLLPIHPEGRLFPARGAFLLLADHQLHLFGLDVLADVPGREAVFVLFFSGDGELMQGWMVI